MAAPIGDIAQGKANAVNSGDNNPLVQLTVAADAIAEASTNNAGNRGTDQLHSDGIVVTGEADTPPPVVPTAEVAANGQPATAMEHYTPLRMTADQIVQSDPKMQDIKPADQKLIDIYGDTIHQNDDQHLDDGIGVGENKKWQ